VTKSTSVRLTDSQRTKLRRLAQALGRTPNHTLGQLIDNAEIVVVPRREAGATLPGMKNSDSAKFSQDARAITASA
jgi:predicted transcriptional regulator